jgi:hypothetical protein
MVKIPGSEWPGIFIFIYSYNLLRSSPAPLSLLS